MPAITEHLEKQIEGYIFEDASDVADLWTLGKIIKFRLKTGYVLTDI